VCFLGLFLFGGRCWPSLTLGGVMPQTFAAPSYPDHRTAALAMPRGPGNEQPKDGSAAQTRRHAGIAIVDQFDLRLP
jgi:hypothetical protein